MKKPALLGDLLKGAMKRAQIGTAVEAAMIVEAAQQFLDERWGKECGVHAVSWERDTLHLKATSAAARNELRLWQEEILKYLEGRFRKGIVKYIRFR